MHELHDEYVVFLLMPRALTATTKSTPDPVKALLEEFKDVFPTELPMRLLPLLDIQRDCCHCAIFNITLILYSKHPF